MDVHIKQSIYAFSTVLYRFRYIHLIQNFIHYDNIDIRKDIKKRQTKRSNKNTKVLKHSPCYTFRTISFIFPLFTQYIFKSRQTNSHKIHCLILLIYVKSTNKKFAKDDPSSVRHSSFTLVRINDIEWIDWMRMNNLRTHQNRHLTLAMDIVRPWHIHRMDIVPHKSLSIGFNLKNRLNNRIIIFV